MWQRFLKAARNLILTVICTTYYLKDNVLHCSRIDTSKQVIPVLPKGRIRNLGIMCTTKCSCHSQGKGSRYCVGMLNHTLQKQMPSSLLRQGNISRKSPTNGEHFLARVDLWTKLGGEDGTGTRPPGFQAHRGGNSQRNQHYIWFSKEYSSFLIALRSMYAT